MKEIISKNDSIKSTANKVEQKKKKKTWQNPLRKFPCHTTTAKAEQIRALALPYKISFYYIDTLTPLLLVIGSDSAYVSSFDFFFFNSQFFFTSFQFSFFFHPITTLIIDYNIIYVNSFPCV